MIESEDNDREAKNICRWFQGASAGEGARPLRRSIDSIDRSGFRYEHGNTARLDEASVTGSEESVGKGNPVGRLDAGAALVGAARESWPGRGGAECVVPRARDICA